MLETRMLDSTARSVVGEFHLAWGTLLAKSSVLDAVERLRTASGCFEECGFLADRAECEARIRALQEAGHVPSPPYVAYRAPRLAKEHDIAISIRKNIVGMPAYAFLKSARPLTPLTETLVAFYTALEELKAGYERLNMVRIVRQPPGIYVSHSFCPLWAQGLSIGRLSIHELLEALDRLLQTLRAAAENEDEQGVTAAKSTIAAIESIRHQLHIAVRTGPSPSDGNSQEGEANEPR